MSRFLRSAAPLTLSIAVLAATGASIEGQSSDASTGTISGVVRLTAAASAPLAASPYGRRGVAPKHKSSEPETQKVLVYVQGLKPAAPPAAMRLRVSQRDEQFLPQVTALTVGSTVDFPNDDPFFHNVFSLSKAKTFDLGRYATGKSRSVLFDKPGVVKVFCDIHSHMTALVMVFEHPWFTIPAEDGTFTLASVPAGDVTIVAWHERIGERRERVVLTAGATAKLSFTLPVLEQAAP